MILQKQKKPLGVKAYGSIGHLPGSKLGPGDHTIEPGQAKILTEKKRGTDIVIVQEKLDGSNVAVARSGGKIVALGRAGYPAITSPYEQHHHFARWVAQREDLFEFLEEGERISGEWLLQAHGTRYMVMDAASLFRPFDIFDASNDRKTVCEVYRIAREHHLIPPEVICSGDAINPLELDIGTMEGLVYRCEDKRKGQVLFLAKWVRSDYEAGKYLPGIGLGIEKPAWNFPPEAI